MKTNKRRDRKRKACKRDARVEALLAARRRETVATIAVTKGG